MPGAPAQVDFQVHPSSVRIAWSPIAAAKLEERIIWFDPKGTVADQLCDSRRSLSVLGIVLAPTHDDVEPLEHLGMEVDFHGVMEKDEAEEGKRRGRGRSACRSGVTAELHRKLNSPKSNRRCISPVRRCEGVLSCTSVQ